MELPRKSDEDGLLASCFKLNEVVSCEDSDVCASLTFGTEDKIEEISSCCCSLNELLLLTDRKIVLVTGYLYDLGWRNFVIM